MKKVLVWFLLVLIMFVGGCKPANNNSQINDDNIVIMDNESSDLLIKDTSYSEVDETKMNEDIGNDTENITDTVTDAFKDINQLQLEKWIELKTEQITTNCTISVNGKNMAEDYCAYIFHKENFAVLPFTAVMKELGASVDWVDATTARIYYKEYCFVLYVDYVALIDSKTGQDYMFGYGGATRSPYFGFVDGEFLIDSDYFSGFLSEINMNFKIDYATSSIYINRKTGDGSVSLDETTE